MKALRALLRASPRCSQVYRTCREMVLSHVAWNHNTPAVVPIALDALEMRENRKYQRDRTEPFLSQKTLKEPHEIPLSIWGRLLCFHEIVDFFISGFTNSRLVALEDSIHPQSQTSLPSKSPRRKEQEKKAISPSIHLSLSQLDIPDWHEHSIIWISIQTSSMIWRYQCHGQFFFGCKPDATYNLSAKPSRLGV